jgi:hypothetical protein
MPSSSALCASMGPSMASPMAKIEGTAVAKWSSTLNDDGIDSDSDNFRDVREILMDRAIVRVMGMTIEVGGCNN